MPTRKDFPKSYFSKNPYRGKSAQDVFRRLRWGNESKRSWEIEAPEPLAVLGTLAMIVFPHERKTFSRRAPYLAVGVKSNWLYLVPRDGSGPLEEIPPGPYHEVSPVLQVDYISKKGNESAYYYHKHEKPYPVLWQEPETGCAIWVPNRLNGRRSYAVSDEGIIG